MLKTYLRYNYNEKDERIVGDSRVDQGWKFKYRSTDRKKIVIERWWVERWSGEIYVHAFAWYVLSPPMKIFIVRRLRFRLIHHTRYVSLVCRSISEAASTANRKLAVIRKREKPYEERHRREAGDDDSRLVESFLSIKKKKKRKNAAIIFVTIPDATHPIVYLFVNPNRIPCVSARIRIRSPWPTDRATARSRWYKATHLPDGFYPPVVERTFRGEADALPQRRPGYKSSGYRGANDPGDITMETTR